MSDMLGSAWTGLDVKKVPIAQALVKPTGLDQDLGTFQGDRCDEIIS